MGTFFQDLRYGLRALRKQPLLTVVAVLSLGLAIGANTTVFTWLQTFVLNPLPAVQGYDRLVAVNTRAPGGGRWSVSYPDFRDWRAQSRTLDIAIADFTQVGMRVAEGGTERVWAVLTAENFFDVLRVPVALGRTFQRGEEDEAAQVAVLGWSFWQRRFSGDGTECAFDKPAIPQARGPSTPASAVGPRAYARPHHTGASSPRSIP